MNIKRICCCMLISAVIGSAVTFSVAARSEIPDDEIPEYLSSGNHTFGLCGDFTGWE